MLDARLFDALDGIAREARAHSPHARTVRAVRAFLTLPYCFLIASLSFTQVRGRSAPFGGIQLLLCGDFFQLPPVCREGAHASGGAFAFAAAAWRDAKLGCVELREPFRQSDPAFFRLLNAVRWCARAASHSFVPLRVACV